MISDTHIAIDAAINLHLQECGIVVCGFGGPTMFMNTIITSLTIMFDPELDIVDRESPIWRHNFTILGIGTSPIAITASVTYPAHRGLDICKVSLDEPSSLDAIVNALVERGCKTNRLASSSV